MSGAFQTAPFGDAAGGAGQGIDYIFARTPTGPVPATGFTASRVVPKAYYCAVPSEKPDPGCAWSDHDLHATRVRY